MRMLLKRKRRKQMKFQRIIFLLLMVFFLGQSLTLWAQVPPPFETPPLITEMEARRFLDEYMDQYMRRDIDGFMDFFSQDAIENRMLTYTGIREIYQGTFENSHSLLYYLEIYSVQINQESATVTGQYKVIQTLKGSHFRKTYTGNIQWDLIREKGFLKIREINYGRDYRGDHPSHPYP
jgi:hypothetical protein